MRGNYSVQDFAFAAQSVRACICLGKIRPICRRQTLNRLHSCDEMRKSDSSYCFSIHIVIQSLSGK